MLPIKYMAEKMGQGGKFGILYQDDGFGKALLAGYQRRSRSSLEQRRRNRQARRKEFLRRGADAEGQGRHHAVYLGT